MRPPDSLSDPAASVPLRLVYDDDDVEAILQGAVTTPTPATVYSAAEAFVERIQAAVQAESESALVATCGELVMSGEPVTHGMLLALLPYFGYVVECLTAMPAAERPCDLLGFLQRLWQLSDRQDTLQPTRRDDPALLQLRAFRAALGPALHRVLERERRYEESRQIISVLLEMSRQDKNLRLEAIHVNNYGFTYWLASDYASAAPYFEQAAVDQRQLGETVEWANARANYWACRFEASGLEGVGVMEPELIECREVLRAAGDWRERKSALYLGKIAEARGDIAAAIPLVERAVEIGRTQQPMYLEIDEAYLARLLAAGHGPRDAAAP